MRIGGLQKTSVIDFPDRLSCTVFTVGCNFACPFCHNGDLAKGKTENLLSENYFFEFLDKRKNVLEGVCITGGEPCLQKDLVEFCQKIKKTDLALKLDTNGSRPEVLERLLKKNLLDMVAMDIKSCFGDYGKTTGVKINLVNIKESIKLILKSGLEYEFRTTVVPGLHDEKSLVKLAEELRRSGGKEIIWMLQKFRASQNCLDKKYRKKKSFNDEEMEGFFELVKKILPKTSLRE